MVDHVHEVVVVGAGVCGLYQIHRLRELGFDAIAIERNGDVGGTWYRNRYPGCRFDSESYTYGYSFDQELLEEWSWSERFAAQPETLQYLNHVADRFDLRKYCRFGVELLSATWDESARVWNLVLDDGAHLRTRFLLTAIGHLSTPSMPRVAGIDSFSGASFHTIDWPEGLNVSGLRVGVVGTGSTGVQVIQTIAPHVESLTVFQRHPNWCAPLGNSPIDADEMADIRRRYDEIFEQCRRTPGSFLHGPDRRKTFEVAEDERLEFWENLYREPGFGIWLGNFVDTMMDEKANEALSDFIAGKIRGRVHDPVTAELLIPRDHGFGTRRVPMETRYYEQYNRENVRLVDVASDPIVTVTETGIQTRGELHELDVIVYATGFHAVTGAFDRIDVRGVGGRSLRDKWENGPINTLGVQSAGFPNFLTLVGPQGGSGATNFPRGIEEIVDWVTDLLVHVRDQGLTRIEVIESAEQEWADHVTAEAEKVLLSKTKSWLTGYNPNAERPSNTPRVMFYSGGAVRYRRRLTAEVDGGYPSFALS